jgi:hypothetical protein
MLESESVLHWDLRGKGYELYLEPAAKISHLNFELLSSWLPAQFHGGRLFAAARAQRWPLSRKLLYVCGAPLIPVVRLWRIRQYEGRSDQRQSIPLGVLPLLGLGLVASAVGEMTGYILGAGSSMEQMSRLEFHRSRHLKKRSKAKVVSGSDLPED